MDFLKRRLAQLEAELKDCNDQWYTQYNLFIDKKISEDELIDSITAIEARRDELETCVADLRESISRTAQQMR